MRLFGGEEKAEGEQRTKFHHRVSPNTASVLLRLFFPKQLILDKSDEFENNSPLLNVLALEYLLFRDGRVEGGGMHFTGSPVIHQR